MQSVGGVVSLLSAPKTTISVRNEAVPVSNLNMPLTSQKDLLNSLCLPRGLVLVASSNQNSEWGSLDGLGQSFVVFSGSRRIWTWSLGIRLELGIFFADCVNEGLRGK